MKKQIVEIPVTPPGHWVGDGFPVRSMFGDRSFTREISPFLMMDYAGPAEFDPTEERRGVGGHPHKGFETVTIVYHGEVEHRDSVGHHGTIGPGDVQWMTAASGILHDEFHSREFARRGGMFEMVQLWVNLPARDKKALPRYQSILNADIPIVSLVNGAGHARLIAGSFQNIAGAAKTFTPILLWDVRMIAGHAVNFEMPEGYFASIFLMHGDITVNDSDEFNGPQLVILSAEGNQFSVHAHSDATILLLGGEPINEPIAAMGPFVMNTKGELRQAMLEFQSGAMGDLPPM